MVKKILSEEVKHNITRVIDRKFIHHVLCEHLPKHYPDYKKLESFELDPYKIKNTPVWDKVTKAGPKTAKSRKDAVCKKLAERTGLSKTTVNNLVGSWAKSSNDSDWDALFLQERASKIFGSPLSEWQKIKLRVVDGRESNIFKSKKSFYPYDSREKAADAFLKAMYDETQEVLARHKITEVVVSRGITFNGPTTLTTMDPGGLVIPSGNAMESWSESWGVARGFCESDYAAVLSSKVPAQRVLSYPVTGFGCSDELEFVVLGNPGKDLSSVTFTRTLRVPLEGRMGVRDKVLEGLE